MDNNESPKVPQLVTTRTDADLAADLRRRFTEAMVPALEIMDEGARAGLALQFAVGPSAVPFRHEVQNLRIVKFY